MRLSLEKKIQLIEDSMKPGFKRKRAMVEYGVSLPFISNLLRDKDKILELSKRQLDKSRKTMRFGTNHLLEEILYEWYVIQQKANIIVTGPMLKAKAEEMSNASSTDNCTFSNGWLEGFKKRYSIQLKSGKSINPTESTNNSLLEQILYQWVVHQQTCNIIITGPMLKAKAEELSKACSTTSEGFRFSTSWLDAFKKRHGIRFRTCEATGKVEKVDPDQKPPIGLQHFPYKQ